jgi:hypothetical protein
MLHEQEAQRVEQHGERGIQGEDEPEAADPRKAFGGADRHEVDGVVGQGKEKGKDQEEQERRPALELRQAAAIETPVEAAQDHAEESDLPEENIAVEHEHLLSAAAG